MSAPRQGKVTERSFYPPLLQVISEQGGSGVSEISYNSFPDIKFDLIGRPWLLSVKIGESTAVVKSAILQYLRHKQESGIENGLLLTLPEAVRRVRDDEQALLSAVRSVPVSVLIDAGEVKEESRDRAFPAVLEFIRGEIAAALERRMPRYYPLRLVVDLLRAQVTDVMGAIRLGEKQILKIVTDRKLLSDLAHLSGDEIKGVTQFLAAYIVLSQILFLRLFRVAHPDIIADPKRVDRSRLRSAFRRVLDINYRDIFEIDVLDAVDDRYIRDTFDLIWGLEIERIRYDLPGRIFHALMPDKIRKMLAAFYTRPQAAEILAKLAIDAGNETVFDPACGSGTILVAAYRRKFDLFRSDRRFGSPHKRFCEEEIFGGDIMPFAVHLTTANLSAMAVEETLDHTQIGHQDSIDLLPGKPGAGLQIGMFETVGRGKRTTGEQHRIVFPKADAVLMNPPFTKVERGIAEYVNMTKFRPLAGGEVGLWGHFVFLAAEFLKDGGTYGAVIPINVLRGRESSKTRDFLFRDWTTRYVLKPTMNYAFSEYAEYRDVIIIADKEAPSPDHAVKFCLVKDDLRTLGDDKITGIADLIKSENHLRSEDLDIDSHPLTDVLAREVNMMWFCGVSDLRHREVLVNFSERWTGILERLETSYLREGYRPVPKGVSQFLFFTRAVHPSRIEEAFLSFEHEHSRGFNATTSLGTRYSIRRSEVVPTVRTLIGLETMDITGQHDYIAHQPYEEFSRVKRACGFTDRLPDGFWEHAGRELEAVRTRLVMCRRINPYAPNTNLIAFVSEDVLSPSNQANVILETNPIMARAMVCVLNSVIFLAQFFLLKEESTGRFIDIRFYDVAQMLLKPNRSEAIDRLQAVFAKFRNAKFPALRDQMDRNFDARYREFWEAAERRQSRFWSILDRDVEPADIRLEFDLDVCRALGFEAGSEQLKDVYRVLVKEIMITRHLRKD